MATASMDATSHHQVEPAKWAIGPPPPRPFSALTRLLQLATLGVVSAWVLGPLGGLGVTPTATGADSNDTGACKLFNWHPLLMTFAFPVLMGEALLVYKAPLTDLRDRNQKKMVHFGLQSGAVVLAALGLVPAFQSHNLKRPVPIPNLYSPHSIMGITVVALLGLQFLVAAFSYLWPKLSLAQRRALGPVHIFLGKSVFTAGLATMAAGLQEKATFLQLGAKVAVRSPAIQLPVALGVLLLATGMAVLYHHVSPATSSKPAPAVVETAEALPEALAEHRPLRYSHDFHDL